MAWDLKKIIKSNRAKKVFLVLILFFVLFFVCNDFVIPWYVNRGGIVLVPSVVGKNVDDALQELNSVGLEGRKGDTRPAKDQPVGEVIIQNPQAGETVKKGRRVYLTISGGEQLVAVPDVKGRTLRDAHFALEREGLKLGGVDYQPSDTFPQNTVVEQSAIPGTRVKRDHYVSLVVSQGAVSQKVKVPDIGGKPLNEATALLKAMGLQVGNITYLQSSTLLPNTVVEQFPRAGELVTTGQSIDLFIVQGGEKKKEIFEY